MVGWVRLVEQGPRQEERGRGRGRDQGWLTASRAKANKAEAEAEAAAAGGRRQATGDGRRASEGVGGVGERHSEIQRGTARYSEIDRSAQQGGRVAGVKNATAAGEAGLRSSLAWDGGWRRCRNEVGSCEERGARSWLAG